MSRTTRVTQLHPAHRHSYIGAMNIGDKVPEFELPDQQGNGVSLGDLLSNGRLVLYFYIKAKTPG